MPLGKGPFPALVLAHGYIDPDIYVNGQGLMREQDYLARAGQRLGANGLRQEGFRRVVAMEDAVFAALLVIDDELERETGIGWPKGMGRPCPIANHIARIVGEPGGQFWSARVACHGARLS